jgi:protein SCO1/2
MIPRRLVVLIAHRCAPCAVVLALSAALFGCQRGKDLPDLGGVPAFSMTDQSGKPVTNESLRGKPWAAAFVFTRCPTICPRVTRVMREVQVAAKEAKVDLRLVSFSVDPDNDTPDVLKRYANEYGADLTTWSFLTGDSRTVKETAEKGFKIAVEGSPDPSKVDLGITHGTQLVLVDPNLRIRGYYTTADEQARKNLVDDARGLAAGR